MIFINRANLLHQYYCNIITQTFFQYFKLLSYTWVLWLVDSNIKTFVYNMISLCEISLVSKRQSKTLIRI